MPLTIKKISSNVIINIVILLVAILVSVKIHKSNAQKITILQKKCTDEKSKTKIIQEIKDFISTIDAYKSKIPPQDSRAIVNNITKLARMADVKIISLKPEKKKEKMKAGRKSARRNRRKKKKEQDGRVFEKTFIDLGLQVEDFHKLGRFISILESDPAVFCVEWLQLQQAGAVGYNQEETALNANLRISKISFND